MKMLQKICFVLLMMLALSFGVVADAMEVVLDDGSKYEVKKDAYFASLIDLFLVIL
jgi:hypothetical protein